MRPLEILVTLFCAAAVAVLVLAPAPGGRRGRIALSLALVAAALAQVRLEGARLELLPLYGAVILLAVLVPAVSGRSRGLRVAAGGFVALLLAATLGAGYAFPVFRLPAPTGPFAVGTSVLTFDAGRGPAVAQLWYPARAPAAGPRAGYWFSVSEPSLRARLSRLRLVKTAAYAGAEVAPGRHPLLLYVPGWPGSRIDNTAQAQELASHGFIVAALDDLYPAPAMDFSSRSAFDATVRWGGVKARLESAAERRLLDELERRDAAAGGALAGRIDRGRIGAFGFSFGGAVSAETARTDPRVRAAVDLDGWLFGDAAAQGVPRPFIVFSGLLDDPPPQSVVDRFHALFDRADDKMIFRGFTRHGGMLLVLAGANHANFADWPLFSPIKQREGGGGSIETARAERDLSLYLDQFFEHFLEGRPAPLLEARGDKAGPDPARATADPAVSVTIWPQPQSSGARSSSTAAKNSLRAVSGKKCPPGNVRCRKAPVV